MMKKRIMTCLLTGAIAFSALGIHVYAEETTDASSELSESIYSFEVKLDGELSSAGKLPTTVDLIFSYRYQVF